ncbi:855_t:CDS:1 [Ambispora gerdemannii]|uniref:855_t:CDS:1 n=1 Tax=Ambispora gerdemannii TaxID=144530 RepID=A0A9N9BT79_9GLOM|nr:855_t:CDS:1 [Ambispora gerdemannii]
MDYRIKGNEAVKRGDYLTAYYEYNKGLVKSPKDPTLWCNRAYVFLKLGYPELTLMDTKRVSNILAETNPSSFSNTHQILGFKAAYRQGEAYTQLKLYKLAINKFNGLLMSLSMNLLNEDVQVDRVSLETKRDFCVDQDKKLSKEFKNYQKFGGDAGEFRFNVGYMWDTRPESRGTEATRQALQKSAKSISLKELKLDRIDFQESQYKSSSSGNNGHQYNNNGDGKKNIERSQIQLGVFSGSFIEAGEVIFQEDSFLCVHNHFTPRCDYCNRPLQSGQIVPCDNYLCQEIFCSTQCYSLALAKYHRQLCGKEIGNILEGTQKGMSNSSLAYLLVLKVFAVAKTRSVHPLDIPEMTHLVRYQLPSELGLSFNANWTQIYQETLDILGISVYDDLRYDFWVYVTCLTTLGCNIFGGKDDHGRPDTASLFPQLATFLNHSCDPNVEHGNVTVDSRFWSRHVFRARKCIQEYEQIFISYVDMNFCKEDRMTNLSYYGFKCNCEKCKELTFGTCI